MNKRGLELAISTIVILILSIVLLIFLVLFFTSSSSDFLEKIKSYFSYSNVDNIIEGCNILADTNSIYAYCCEKKSVRYLDNGKKSKEELSCSEIAEKVFGKNIKKLNCDLDC